MSIKIFYHYENFECIKKGDFLVDIVSNQICEIEDVEQIKTLFRNEKRNFYSSMKEHILKVCSIPTANTLKMLQSFFSVVKEGRNYFLKLKTSEEIDQIYERDPNIVEREVYESLRSVEKKYILNHRHFYYMDRRDILEFSDEFCESFEYLEIRHVEQMDLANRFKNCKSLSLRFSGLENLRKPNKTKYLDVSQFQHLEKITFTSRFIPLGWENLPKLRKFTHISNEYDYYDGFNIHVNEIFNSRHEVKHSSLHAKIPKGTNITSGSFMVDGDRIPKINRMLGLKKLQVWFYKADKLSYFQSIPRLQKLSVGFEYESNPIIVLDKSKFTGFKSVEYLKLQLNYQYISLYLDDNIFPRLKKFKFVEHDIVDYPESPEDPTKEEYINTARSFCEIRGIEFCYSTYY